MSTGSWFTHLCFHGVGNPQRTLEEGEAGYWIGTDAFRRVLDLAVADPGIRLSFDDGNASDIEIGLSELEQRGLTATFFPLAGRLDQPGSLTSADVRALAVAGMQVGSHGFHHQSWRNMDDHNERLEFDEARLLLQSAAGADIQMVACPRGSYDRNVFRALRRRGYSAVFTSDWASARQGAWVQPRFSVRAVDQPSDIGAHIAQRKSLMRRNKARARVLAKSWR